MRSRQSYIGMRFGKLTAISEAEPKLRKDRPAPIRRMECRCDCGQFTIAAVPDLKSGNTQSCGCHKIEAIIKSNTTHGHSISISRGGKASLEYNTWRAMIDRCENPRHISYPLYGGRGITVCQRWRSSFKDFLSDMGEKPSKLHSIERERNDGNYEPGNCRWATAKEQFANKRISPEFLAHMGR
jgi:hypothetical protein